ncbi:unnamed protein product, partial [Polarella glacialis]
ALSTVVVLTAASACLMLLSPLQSLTPESDLDGEDGGLISVACGFAEALVSTLADTWGLGSDVSAGGARKRKKKSLELTCVVCLEAPRQILLLPCRHVCCCKVCATRLDRCPMCRAGTTSSSEVFL